MSFDILVEFGSQCQIIWTFWTGSQFIAWRRWPTNRLIERKCKSQMPESQDDFTNFNLDLENNLTSRSMLS